MALTEALVVQKFDVKCTTDKQALLLHLVCGKSEFHFLLTPEAATHLLAGLDKGLTLLDPAGSGSTH